MVYAELQQHVGPFFELSAHRCFTKLIPGSSCLAICSFRWSHKTIAVKMKGAFVYILPKARDFLAELVYPRKESEIFYETHFGLDLGLLCSLINSWSRPEWYIAMLPF